VWTAGALGLFLEEARHLAMHDKSRRVRVSALLTLAGRTKRSLIVATGGHAR